MKRKLLFLSLFLMGMVLYAQDKSNTFYKSENPFEKIYNKRVKKTSITLESPKGIGVEERQSMNVFDRPELKSVQQYNPALIYEGLLNPGNYGGNWEYIENNKNVLYNVSYTFKNVPGRGNYFKSITIAPLNDKLEEGAKHTVIVPENTNSYRIESLRNSSYYAMFTHSFFEPSGSDWSPFQRDSLWLINDNGQVLKKWSAAGAYLTANNKLIVSVQENPDKKTGYDGKFDFHIYDATTLEEEKSILIPNILLIGNAGIPFDIIKMDGKEYLIINHYEKPYNTELGGEIRTPDNSFLIKIYDLETYEIVGQTKFPLPNDIGEHQPVAGFGVFAYGSDLQITKKLFNDDDKYEFIITIEYEHPSQASFYSHYVIDENGTVIKEVSPDGGSLPRLMKYIEGFDEQVCIDIPDDDGGIVFNFFDIQSWKYTTAIKSGFDKDTLMAVFERMPVDDSYQYVFMVHPKNYEKNENGMYQAKLKVIDRDAKLVDQWELELSDKNALDFVVTLRPYTMYPDLFDDDKEGAMEFYYGYVDVIGGKYGDSHFKIAKPGQKPILHITYNDTDGDPYGGNFWYANSTDELPKQLYFEFESGRYYFYNLPLRLNPLSIEDEKFSIESSSKAYYSKLENSIIVNGQIKSTEVFDIQGIRMHKGNYHIIPAAGWVKGVYIVKTQLENGNILFDKVLVQ